MGRAVAATAGRDEMSPCSRSGEMFGMWHPARALVPMRTTTLKPCVQRKHGFVVAHAGKPTDSR
jgi:hypothetical protein